MQHQQLESSVRSILWVDSDLNQADLITKSIESFGYKVFFVNSLASAEALLREHKIELAVVDFKIENGSGLDLLIQLHTQYPDIIRVLKSSQINLNIVRDAINKAQTHQIFENSHLSVTDYQHLESLLYQKYKKNKEDESLREISRQNKELELLASDLESEVNERTAHIEASADEESLNLNRVKLLIKFIKDLSLQLTIEDVLQVFRKELKSFHKVGEPILIMKFNQDQSKLISFRSGQIVKRQITEVHDFSDQVIVNDPSYQRKLAQYFERPFSQVLVYPLTFDFLSSFSMGVAQADVCIEHFLNEVELEDLIEFIDDRIKSMNIAIEKILIEEQLAIFTYRWEQTFDGIADPIAILDEDAHLIRANKKFLSNPIQVGENSLQSGISLVNQNSRSYELHSYPIRMARDEHATSYVQHYVDVTIKNQLKVKSLQNEKMEAIGKLAGNIAHELNNPLTGLRSLAQVLLLSDANPQLKEDLVEIEKASERCQRIIKNLLDFSKEGDGDVVLFSMDEVIEKTFPLLKTSMRIHRYDLNLKTKDFLAKADPHLIQQVFFNLVNNACQAMTQSGLLIIETSIQQINDKSYICTEVKDTGPGMSAEIQNRIFEPFFTTKAEGVGTGLGLSISKSIVEKFNGFLKLRSEVGQGTSFYIYLPGVPS